MFNQKFLREFFKYAVVGASGLLVNLFFLGFFTEIFGMHYLVSEVFAFFIATSSNFVLNKTWTFRERIRNEFSLKGIKFFTVACFSLLINLFFLWFFTEVAGIYYLLSQVLAAGFTLMSNFAGNKLWTFNFRI